MRMGFWVGLVIGLVVGSFASVLMLALCAASKDADERVDEFKRANGDYDE